MDTKKPLKSALKKTTAAVPVPALTSAKRKHTPTVSTKTHASKGNKRVKDNNNSNNNNSSKSKPNSQNTKKNNNNKTSNDSNSSKPKQQLQKQAKSVAIKTPSHQSKKKGPVTAGMVAGTKKKVVATKPKKVEVIPEGATFEDFRVVAGTYENVLYGVDAYWNEDMSLRLSPIFAFSAHIGCIKSLASGGHFLATGSTDEKIQLYDLKRRKELGNLLQHQGTITALTFHNKTHMLSGSDDGKICVWRSKDWECLKIMKGNQNTVHSIAIHPSGKIALSVAADHSVRLWNLLLGKQASMTRLSQGEGLKVAWNPSGTGYSIMFDQEVGIFEMATAKCIRTIKPAKKTRFNTMRYYKDDYLLVGCEDKIVRVYSTSTGDLVKALLGHAARIKDMDVVTVPFTPEETSNKGMRAETKIVDVLTTVSSDGVMKFWNMEEVVEPVKGGEGADLNMKTTLGEHKAEMRVTCLATQQGIWKNAGVDSFAAEEDEGEEEDIAMQGEQGSDDDDKSDDDEDEENDEDE
ncbi:p21-activated protein kinase-interacting protein 1-like protein [Podila humilis]|nr:p21-activated protein kinase-interacting protein 1-like protein [Podila humilis]